jgi:uncharacterized membrane protein (UPF0127 family)
VYEPLVEFDSAAARIVTETDTIRLRVDVADTDDRRAYGLMERAQLPEYQGMIFVYEEEQGPDNPFWMYRTLLPLDIAFLDDAGRIVAIRAMEPCPSPNPQLCRRYAPGVPYWSALEVGEGRLEQWGIEPGDRVIIDSIAAPD